MKTLLTTALVLVLGAAGVSAQTADRLSDNDIKKLIESVNEARDRFEDQLEGKVKDGVIRSASGEMRVSSSLDDLQQDVEKLKSRFTGDYSASTEVQALLRRAGAFDALMKNQPAGLKGANEWERFAGVVRQLATAYQAAFPLPEGATVRRINDSEAAATAAAIAAQADLIKQAANADKTMAKADKQALLAEISALAKQAKLVQSRLKDGKPATADARLLRKAIVDLTKEGRQLPPAVLSAAGALRAPLLKLEQAFGVTSGSTT